MKGVTKSENPSELQLRHNISIHAFNVDFVKKASFVPRSEFTDVSCFSFQVLYGTDSDRARWRTCVSYTNDNFGMAVGRLFVQKYFNEGAKASVSEVLSFLLCEKVQTI